MGPYRTDRSRSPTGGRSEWVSRQVATFARHKAKRPRDLEVDGSGGFSLEQLAASWGAENDLTKAQILSALQRHMYHENSNHLRFQMIPEAGDTTIRVHRSRDAVTGTGEAPARTVPKKNKPREGGSPWSVWGSVASELPAEDRDDRPWVRKRGGWRTWKSDSDAWKGRSSWGNKAEWKNSWDWKLGPGRTVGEKVQRWLSYVLRAGAVELGIEVEDGWASTDVLAEALEKTRSDLGITTGEQLCSIVRESDLEGRFEIDDRGRLRKVDREGRQPKAASASEAAPKESEDAPSKAPASKAPTPKAAPPKAEPPPDPPGDHWVKYIDDDVMWWFYDGPQGKWWKQESDDKPQPWTED